MTTPSALCPRCGQRLHTGMGTERVIAAPNGAVRASIRVFVAECSRHGKVVTSWKTGHHSTQAEANLKRRYRKPGYKLLVDLLPPEDHHKFVEAMHGRFLASPEDIARWDRIISCRIPERKD